MAAEWPAEAGAAGPANPLQVAALVGSLVLIIVAMYIVFTSLAPLFSKGEDDPGGSQADPGASTSQTGPDASSTPSGSQGDISQPEPEPPVTVDVTSLTLDKSDFTLQAGESATIQAAVVPADAEITWSSSDESAATVSPEGVVSNVNTGSSQVKVTITATAGDQDGGMCRLLPRRRRGRVVLLRHHRNSDRRRQRPVRPLRTGQRQ